MYCYANDMNILNPPDMRSAAVFLCYLNIEGLVCNARCNDNKRLAFAHQPGPDGATIIVSLVCPSRSQLECISESIESAGIFAPCGPVARPLSPPVVDHSLICWPLKSDFPPLQGHLSDVDKTVPIIRF
jgi:hypothetical protein